MPSVDSISKIVKNEIDKLEKQEARLKGSVNSLQKEVNGLMERKNNLKNEIITKVQEADAEIDKRKEAQVQKEKKATEALTNARVLEGTAQSLKTSLENKIEAVETRSSNLIKSEAKYANEVSLFKQRVEKLNKALEALGSI